MALDAVSELGSILGGTISTQNEIKQNISPDSADAIDNLGFAEKVKVSGTLTGIQKPLGTNCFVIDHPVYGDIDSSVLEIDGGYQLISEGDGCVMYLKLTVNPV